MVAAGIVTITDDGKYSLPHDETKLKIWGHNAAAIPILSEMIPKLEEATTLDGPKGSQNTYEHSTFMNHNYNTLFMYNSQVLMNNIFF